MESLIAKLLKDFEDGRMNRRQLIQSLAMAAAAVAVPGRIVRAAPAQAAAGSAPVHFKAVALDHISYQVADYKVTRDFYADLLGMTVSDDDGQRQCQMHFGDEGSFLLPRNGGGGRAASANASASQAASANASASQGRGQGRGGAPALPRVDHISYKIANWDTDKVEAELNRRNLTGPGGRGKPQLDTGGPTGPKHYASFHVADPDGYNLQISGEVKPGDRLWKG